jgi:acyl carrier protein
MNLKEAELIVKNKIKVTKDIYSHLDSLGKIKILIKTEKKLNIKLNSDEIENIFNGNYNNFLKKLSLIFLKKKSK